jgi:cytidylate kinase
MTGGTPLIITIDGPAGSGKSHVALRVARRIGFAVLDTGAMYRAATAIAIDDGIGVSDGPAIAERLRCTPLRVDWSTDPPGMWIGDRDVSSRLRDPDVSAHVSPVSAFSAIRRVLVEAQRAAAASHGRIVTEGRDQGSVVFPDAPLKIYLNASPEVRARRRTKQLIALGQEADESEVLAAILKRDEADSTRDDSPLRCPDDAVRLDTTDMTREQVITEIVRLARERLGLDGGVD